MHVSYLFSCKTACSPLDLSLLRVAGKCCIFLEVQAPQPDICMAYTDGGAFRCNICRGVPQVPVCKRSQASTAGCIWIRHQKAWNTLFLPGLHLLPINSSRLTCLSVQHMWRHTGGASHSPRSTFKLWLESAAEGKESDISRQTLWLRVCLRLNLLYSR